MSHLTDAARAPYRIEHADHDDPNSLEAIVAANPSRRKILVNGLFGLALAPMVASCGGDGNGAGNNVTLPPNTGTAPTPTPTPAPAPSFSVTFNSVPANQNDRVTVPTGYETAVLLKAGDLIEPGVAGFSGAFPTPGQAEKWAGGNHDGMELFAIPNTDANTSGVLAVNFEYPDFNILMSDADAAAVTSNPASATAAQRQLALSAGV